MIERGGRAPRDQRPRTLMWMLSGCGSRSFYRGDATSCRPIFLCPASLLLSPGNIHFLRYPILHAFASGHPTVFRLELFTFDCEQWEGQCSNHRFSSVYANAVLCRASGMLETQRTSTVSQQPQESKMQKKTATTPAFQDKMWCRKDDKWMERAPAFLTPITEALLVDPEI